MLKRILLGCMFCIALSTQVHAQTDTTRIMYYYYPSQNIYFNQANGEYFYYDKPTARWASSMTLPTAYVIEESTPKYEVWYKGRDVWKNNKADMAKYKSKTKGNKTTTKSKPQ